MAKRGKTRIRRQLYVVYTLALMIPLAVVGMMLIFSARQNLNGYYMKLLESDNGRVKALLSEITMQSYKVSDEVCFDSTLHQLLKQDYADSSEFLERVNGYNDLELLTYNSLEIAHVYIYTDNPTVQNYRQFRSVTEEVAQSDWYTKSQSTTNAFWMRIPQESTSGFSDNLCLIRRINLSRSDYHAVAVVQVSDPYIRSRVDSGSIIDVVSVDDQGVVYSSRSDLYGQQTPAPVDYSQPYYRFSGEVELDGKEYFAAVSTVNLYMTTSKMYVCTLDDSGLADIRQITLNWLLILLLALVVPLVIVVVYAHYFSNRVGLLREEMHKASQREYDIITKLGGNDELTEVFEDLKTMVRDIKDKDARMYEAELKEQELVIKQQLMEYKMLSAQINPHYLYNTLETIRMKALTTGNRDVADAIKLLGKTLHYVLENTGTAMTTLRRELDHVENYLAVQRLRFGERINYTLLLEPGLEERAVLPLLLQPVVENAVVHGLETAEGTGMVTISVSAKEDGLYIDVRDNGVGMTEEQLRSVMDGLDVPQMPRSSIALYNIHQRIRLRYGEGYGLTMESTVGQGTCVRLRLPAE